MGGGRGAAGRSGVLSMRAAAARQAPRAPSRPPHLLLPHAVPLLGGGRCVRADLHGRSSHGGLRGPRPRGVACGAAGARAVCLLPAVLALASAWKRVCRSEYWSCRCAAWSLRPCTVATRPAAAGASVLHAGTEGGGGARLLGCSSVPGRCARRSGACGGPAARRPQSAGPWLQATARHHIHACLSAELVYERRAGSTAASFWHRAAILVGALT